MHIGVYVGVWNDGPEMDALGLLTKAAGLGDVEVTALLCGARAAAFASEVARYGARRVLVLDHVMFSQPVSINRVDVLARAISQYSIDTLLFSTTVITTELAAALAARFDAGISWGMTELVLDAGRLTGERPIINDTLVAEVEWTTDVKAGLFRPGAFEPVPSVGPPSSIESMTVQPASQEQHPCLVEQSPVATGEGPSLGAADTIVSGGRGLGKAENFTLIRELAAALDGAAGASLPVVEMGWAPRAMQVGQTGSIVRPRLYIACGISGQIQHRIGMERSGTIVAINTDPGAPIKNFSDLFITADLHEILPRLIELLQLRNGVGPR